VIRHGKRGGDHGVSAYAVPYNNLPPPLARRRRDKDDPIWPSLQFRRSASPTDAGERLSRRDYLDNKHTSKLRTGQGDDPLRMLCLRQLVEAAARGQAWIEWLITYGEK